MLLLCLLAVAKLVFFGGERGIVLNPDVADSVQGHLPADNDQRPLRQGLALADDLAEPRRESTLGIDAGELPSDEPVAELDAPGLRLHVRAMWGSVAPISHQGFGLTLQPMLEEDDSLPAKDREQQGLPAAGQVAAQASIFRIAVADAHGQLSFEGLPAGKATLQPLESGLGGQLVAHDLVLSGDTFYEYVVPPGLSYSGRLLGEKRERYRVDLCSSDPGQPSQRAWGRMSSLDGSFQFHGLSPGEYFVQLFDLERWEVAHRYPTFVLASNVFDAQHELPRLGSLEFNVWELPEGLELVGSYLKRSSGTGAVDASKLWFLNAELSRERFRFVDVPFGDYELHVRTGKTTGDQRNIDGVSVAQLGVTIDRAQQHMDWRYVQQPRVWLRIFADKPDAGSSAIFCRLPQNQATDLEGNGTLLGQKEWSGTLVELDTSQLTLWPDGPNLEPQNRVSGNLRLRSAAGGFEHQQGFVLLNGVLESEGVSQKPFSDSIERRPGCMALLIPSSAEYLELVISAEGYLTREVQFPLRDGETIEVKLSCQMQSDAQIPTDQD